MELNIDIAFVHSQNEIQYVSEWYRFEYSEQSVHTEFVYVFNDILIKPCDDGVVGPVSLWFRVQIETESGKNVMKQFMALSMYS